MELQIEKMKEDMRKFLLWEDAVDFKNWQEIEVYLADSLSEAWIKARPNDVEKFNNDSFREQVDSANGKWLEKQAESDTYKIILSTKDRRYEDILQTYVHELIHCIDYQNAVKDLSFDEYCCGNSYFNEWSEFRAIMISVKMEYWLKTNVLTMSSKDIFNALASILGVRAADAVHGIMYSRESAKDIRYYIARYLGVQRAIRNLNSEYNEISPVFHLWTMMPTYVMENFGCIFYLANEWETLSICSLDNNETGRYVEYVNKVNSYVTNNSIT